MEQRFEGRTWHLAFGTWHSALGTDIRGQRSVPIAIGSKISADAGGPLQGKKGAGRRGWRAF